MNFKLVQVLYNLYCKVIPNLELHLRRLIRYVCYNKIKLSDRKTKNFPYDNNWDIHI